MLEKWRQRCWFKSADKLGRCGPGIEWPTLVGYTQHVLVPEQITGWLPVTPEMPHIDRPQQLNHLLYILKVTCVQAKRLRSIRHGCETSWVVLRCLALGGWQWILWGPVGFWGLWPPWIGFFFGMSQRLGTGEFAGQVNALSCADWHWGMPLTGGLLLGPQHCFGWLCVSIVKMQHPHECQDPGFPSRILTLHWMICVLLCLLWVLMFLLIAVYHVPQTTACLQHTSDRSTWSLSYSYSWLGLGTETTWLSLGTFCGLGLKYFTWRPPLPPWYLLRSLEVTLGS